MHTCLLITPPVDIKQQFDGNAHFVSASHPIRYALYFKISLRSGVNILHGYAFLKEVVDASVHRWFAAYKAANQRCSSALCHATHIRAAEVMRELGWYTTD